MNNQLIFLHFRLDNLCDLKQIKIIHFNFINLTFLLLSFIYILILYYYIHIMNKKIIYSYYKLVCS